MHTFEDFQAAARELCSVANEAFLPKKELDRWFSGLRVTTMIEQGISTSECARRLSVSRQTVYDVLDAAKGVDLATVRRFMDEPHPIASIQMVTEHPRPAFRIAEELGWTEGQTRSHILEALSRGYVAVAGSQELVPGSRETFYQTTGKPYVHPDPVSPEDIRQRMLRTVSIVRRARARDSVALKRSLSREGFEWARERILPQSANGEPQPPFFTDYLAARDEETKSRRNGRQIPAGIDQKRTDGVALGFGAAPGKNANEALWRFIEDYGHGSSQVYPAFVGLDDTARKAFLKHDIPRIMERMNSVLDEAARQGPRSGKENYMLVLTWAKVGSRRTGERDE